MRFDRVRLRNFKPYEEADLRLDDGVTVIHGLNGSGKSTLLEACFFALYGSRALDGTLEDVVTTGEEETEVELWFTHDGEQYRIERQLRRYDDRTQTTTCVLEGPEGTREGASDVRAFVGGTLLRMDAEAFVNCAYVRQGEVNKLINATPADRQAMLDELLQLGKLEEYRERASRARLGVEDVLTAKRELLEDKRARVEELEERDLYEALNALESDLDDAENDVERFESSRERARETLREAESVLESYEEKRRTLEALDDDVERLREQISETERERDDLGDRLPALDDRRADLREEIDTKLADAEVDAADGEAVAERLAELEAREDDVDDRLQERRMAAQALAAQSEKLTEKADDQASRAAEKRERADELEAEVDDAEAGLNEQRATVEEIEREIESLRAEFDDAPVDLGGAEDRIAALEADHESLRERQVEASKELDTAERRVADAEALLEEGKCPECGQPVEGSPHVETLDGDRERVAELRERLDDLEAERDDLEAEIDRAEELRGVEEEIDDLRTRRENLRQLLEEREATLAEKRERVETLHAEADDLDERAASNREVAAEKSAEATDERDAVADLEAERGEIESARDRLEAVRELQSDCADVADEIDRLRERRESLVELNDERRDRIADKRDRRDELREAVDEERVEQAREDEARASDYLDKVDSKLADLADRRDELQAEIGGVKADIRQLESTREEHDALAERVEALESLHEETEALERMYGDLRAELRRRNVETLERMLNETFDLVYGNDAYARIRLDDEYGLTVVQKDGTELDPEQLSGGERALFNLSLRFAIYRLLAEGIEGAAPMPPLILDEPTVFLDSGHVSRLVDLVEEMRELGVQQSVIVSHDEELVGAADELVTVEKDPTSNRSTVGRTAANLLSD